MEQEIKRRGRPKKAVELAQEIEESKPEEVGEVICGHNSLIQDAEGAYCALCGKRV